MDSILGIDKNSPIAFYIQLRDILKNCIEQEHYKPEERIPSENELAATYQISRMTVRQAVQALVREGYLYVRRGEGTFVERTNSTQMHIKFDGFSHDMSKLGYRPSSEVLNVSRIRFSKKYEAVYSRLLLSTKAPALLIERIRYLDKDPFAVETAFLAWQLGEELLNREFGADFSIYRYLEKERGLQLHRAEHVIQLQQAKVHDAKLLKIRQGESVLCISGTTYSHRNMPVEYLAGIYRGDKYRLKVGITK